ncbi:MAG: hypothetical protein U0903_21300 [Planctomycetales bacterium]
MSLLFRIACLLVGIVCAGTMPLVAQEKEKNDSPPQEKAAAEDPQKSEKPATVAKPPPGKLPAHSGMARQNPVEKILKGMQLSETKVRSSDTSKETLETQKQIVKDLDALIKALQQQQNQQPPPSSSPQQNQQQQDQNQQQNQSQQERQQAQPQNSREQQEAERQRQQRRNAQTRSEADKSRESGPRKETKTNSKPEEGSTAAYEKDVWGHLPPAMRRELLNIYREKFIPKYDEMVRKYYEALSEGNQNPDNRGPNAP